MNTEDDKVASSAKKMPPEKPSRPRAQFIEWTQILAAVLSMIATIVAGIGSNILSSRILPMIPPAYLTVLVIVLSAGVGLGTVSYIVIKLYRRQVQERHLMLEELRFRERRFFQSIEPDIATLLEEGGTKW